MWVSRPLLPAPTGWPRSVRQRRFSSAVSFIRRGWPLLSNGNTVNLDCPTDCDVLSRRALRCGRRSNLSPLYAPDFGPRFYLQQLDRIPGERGFFSLANQGQVLQTAFVVGNGHFRVSLQEGDDRIAFAGLQQRGLERGRETPVYGPRPHVWNGVAQRIRHGSVSGFKQIGSGDFRITRLDRGHAQNHIGVEERRAVIRVVARLRR